MVDQTLCGEPSEQTPGDAVLKMQLHSILSEPAGVLESDLSDRRPLPPLAEPFASQPAGTQCIDYCGPSGVVGKRRGVSRKDEPAWSIGLSLPVTIRLRDSGSAGEPQAHRQGLAKLWSGKADMGAGTFQPVAEAVDFAAQPFLARTCFIKFVLDNPLAVAKREILDEGRKLVEPVTPHSLCTDGLRNTLLENLRNATKFLPDPFDLVHQYLQDAILGSLGVDEVTAEHFVSRLQLAVDTTVALIKTAGIPGKIEVKKVMAMAL